MRARHLGLLVTLSWAHSHAFSEYQPFLVWTKSGGGGGGGGGSGARFHNLVSVADFLHDEEDEEEMFAC
jgi:hypothetical protein